MSTKYRNAKAGSNGFSETPIIMPITPLFFQETPVRFYLERKIRKKTYGSALKCHKKPVMPPVFWQKNVENVVGNSLKMIGDKTCRKI